MSLAIKIIRKIDKYLNGGICITIGFFLKKNVKKTLKIKKIAFVKLWAIGDSVTTLPLIKQIKEKNNHSKITVIATKRNIEVYTGLKYVDEIVTLELKKIFEIIKLFRKFDLVFDLEPYLNFSALVSLFIGKYQVGFPNQTRSVLYNSKSEFSKTKHIVDIYTDLGKGFGTTKAKKLEKLYVSKKDKEQTNNFLKGKKINTSELIIGICPGAAESVKERMWSKEKFAKLADKLIDKYNAKIIFIGSPKEHTQILDIQKLMNNKSLNCAGKLNLKQTIYLIENCKIFISNDTGPMHIAAAQGCKTIGLFGPNTPIRWAPYGKNNISIYHKQWCSPCIINEKGIMPACINKEFQKCMKLISIEEVEKNIQSIIKSQ